MSKLAAIQMNSGGDLAANLDRASNLLQRAASIGAGLVVLPENFACMPEHMASRRCAAETDGCGPVQRRIRKELCQKSYGFAVGFVRNCIIYVQNNFC